MAEYYFPMRSIDGDRKAGIDLFTRYFGSLVSDGVFPGATNLQVTQGTGMNVSVASGKAWLNSGYFYYLSDTATLSIDASDSVLKRIDRIVVRWDDENREIGLAVVKGTAASTPVAPTLTRAGDIYEMGIATVYVAAGVTSIAADAITDTRLETDVCGIVSSLITPDTSGWFANFQAAFDAFMADVEAVLSEEAAGELLVLVNARVEKPTPKASLDSPVQNNTEYRLGTYNSATLTINLPSSGNYECWIRFTAGASMTTLAFSGGTATWLGLPVEIEAGLTYELSIKDGYVIGAKEYAE